MSIRPHRMIVPAVVAALCAAGAAWAGTTFQEPKGIKKQVKRVHAKAQKAAWNRVGLSDWCSKQTWMAPGIGGAACRVSVLRDLAGKNAPRTARDAQTALKNTARALELASQVAAYQPLNAPPQFARLRRVAHTEACGLAFDTLDAKVAPKTGAKARAVLTNAQFSAGPGAIRVLKGKAKGQNLHAAACGCGKRSLGLAQTAPAEVTGALQQLLTSHGCFLNLDGNSAVNVKKGGPAQFEGEAQKLASASDDGARLRDFALTRSMLLDRCTSKWASGRKVAKPKKLENCACREVQRWKFPRHKRKGLVTFTMPLKDKLTVDVSVSRRGLVKQCGNLQGVK